MASDRDALKLQHQLQVWTGLVYVLWGATAAGVDGLEYLCFCGGPAAGVDGLEYLCFCGGQQLQVWMGSTAGVDGLEYLCFCGGPAAGVDGLEYLCFCGGPAAGVDGVWLQVWMAFGCACVRACLWVACVVGDA
eukprot:366559-Chlamydomonas_euryale.AAC.17